MSNVEQGVSSFEGLLIGIRYSSLAFGNWISIRRIKSIEHIN